MVLLQNISPTSLTFSILVTFIIWLSVPTPIILLFVFVLSVSWMLVWGEEKEVDEASMENADAKDHLPGPLLRPRQPPSPFLHKKITLLECNLE